MNLNWEPRSGDFGDFDPLLSIRIHLSVICFAALRLRVDSTNDQPGPRALGLTPRLQNWRRFAAVQLGESNRGYVGCKHELALAASVNRCILVVMKDGVISSSADVMGGTPVFAGTRVPVQTLIEYLEGGESIDDFLEGFPSVKREQIVAFLEEAKEKVLADVK